MLNTPTVNGKRTNLVPSPRGWYRHLGLCAFCENTSHPERDMTPFIDHLLPKERDGFPVMAGYLPGIGHFPTLHYRALDAFRRAERELGPFVQVCFGFGQWYLFCLGADMFDLLKHKSIALTGARGSLEYILGESLLALDGAAHRHVRSAMTPAFSPRGLGESTAATVTLETVERHVRAFVDQGGGNVHTHMQEMALDVIFRIVGVDIIELAEWRAHYRRLLWGLLPVPFEVPGAPRYFALKAKEWVDRELRRLIRRAQKDEGATVLHALVRAKDEDGHLLAEDELVANLRVLFLAGHETTATTTTFAVAHLAQRPELARRLTEEVLAAGGEPPRTFAEVKALPLCEAVFREAVRLYGPAWMLSRKITDDITVRGTHLAAGTEIALCSLLWGYDNNLYPNPDRFEPERWLHKPMAPTPYELSQFGGGPHFCLGYHLAWLESVQYLASLALALHRSGKQLTPVGSGVPGLVRFPMPRPSPAARVRIEG